MEFLSQVCLLIWSLLVAPFVGSYHLARLLANETKKTWKLMGFQQQMAKRGRFKKWLSLEAKLKAGEGTVVLASQTIPGLDFQGGYDFENSVWWTPEGVMEKAPNLSAEQESSLQTGIVHGVIWADCDNRPLEWVD